MSSDVEAMKSRAWSELEAFTEFVRARAADGGWTVEAPRRHAVAVPFDAEAALGRRGATVVLPRDVELLVLLADEDLNVVLYRGRSHERWTVGLATGAPVIDPYGPRGKCRVRVVDPASRRRLRAWSAARCEARVAIYCIVCTQPREA